jgi:hypothetical protein
VERELTRATARAEEARWWRLYEHGEQALSDIAYSQGHERPAKSLSPKLNTVNVWRFAQAVGRKIIGMPV